jgi:hypothetical protein
LAQAEQVGPENPQTVMETLDLTAEHLRLEHY